MQALYFYCRIVAVISFSRHPHLTLVYLLQLLLSSWKRSILPGVCGILAGFIYRLNILRIRKAKVLSTLMTGKKKTLHVFFFSPFVNL